MRGEIVCLLPEDEEIAYQAAKIRTDSMRGASAENLLVDTSRSEFENELAGVKAEIAVRRFLMLDSSLETMANTKSDGGIDIEINGITIDVKWTHYENGLLLFNSPQKFRALCAVLVCPYERYLMRLAGVVSRKTFFENYVWFQSPMHDKPRYSMSQDKLQPMYKLTNFLQNKRAIYVS